MLYLPFQHSAFENRETFLSDRTQIHCRLPLVGRMLAGQAPADAGAKPVRNAHFELGLSDALRERIRLEFNTDCGDNPESYAIEIGDEIQVRSSSERGLFYGAAALAQLSRGQALRRGLIYDYPVCPVRGVKVYLPARSDIGYFKRFVDMICDYRFNTIMIEIGGAMEYKKHPEINRGWTDYCREMSEFSGKTDKIQWSFKWRKNSIHVENGGGGFLTQAEVADLAAYCRERMLNVIPEAPALSHCDYLLINHRELAERRDDPYPDTYCPSNPGSYELWFDVLEEIIAVFQPETINIGHDEYYSIGVCERCRGRKADEIFADDIAKTHAFLARHGVKTMIWGEKLLDAHTKRGAHGGAEVTVRNDAGECTDIIPATFKAIDRVPRDLQILHWYWGMDERLEEQYLARGLETIYGNFYGTDFPNWSARLKRGIRGAIISNWSALKEENLQRNLFFFNLAFSGYMFWQKGYDDSQFEAARDFAFQSLFDYKQSGARGTEPAESAQEIRIVHTTDFNVKYRPFVDGIFIEPEVYHIGDYCLRYADGGEERLPVIYGQNIGNRDADWSRRRHADEAYFETDKRLYETSFTCRPRQAGGRTFYECVFANPRPGQAVTGIEIKPRPGKNCRIELREVAFPAS